MLAAMAVWVHRLLDLALTRAIDGLLTLRRRVRSGSTGLAPEQTGGVVPIAMREGVASALASVSSWREPPHASCEADSFRTRAELTDPALCGATRAQDAGFDVAQSAESRRDRTWWAERPLSGVGGLRLAPPPPRGSQTPAHRVLRLGDALESPIHSQNPDDWEDLVMPSGAVWLAPRGMQALADRAYAAFHVRTTFRLVK
jgi:hypothetical protein